MRGASARLPILRDRLVEHAINALDFRVAEQLSHLALPPAEFHPRPIKPAAARANYRCL